MKPKVILALTIIILAAALLGCQDLDINRRGFQLTHAASGPAEEQAYATATAGARERRVK